MIYNVGLIPDDQKSERLLVEGRNYFNYAKVPVMQFINELDRNNKPIYEDDVLFITFPNSPEWKPVYLQVSGMNHAEWWHMHGGSVEILGNVHENPEFIELIKDSQGEE